METTGAVLFNEHNIFLSIFIHPLFFFLFSFYFLFNISSSFDCHLSFYLDHPFGLFRSLNFYGKVYIQERIFFLRIMVCIFIKSENDFWRFNVLDNYFNKQSFYSQTFWWNYSTCYFLFFIEKIGVSFSSH